MKSILTGNGGVNEIQEVSCILNIEASTTAAYSPFQNGLCEQIHAVTDSIFFFFFNWYSLHARLNSHYEAWSYKKRKHKKVKAYRKPI